LVKLKTQIKNYFVNPKFKLLSSFTNIHVIQNDLLSSVEHKRRYFEKWTNNQTFSVPIDFYCMYCVLFFII